MFKRLISLFNLISTPLDYQWLPLIFIFLFCIVSPASSKTLEVGPGKSYASPSQAAVLAMPGDTILIFPSVYSGGYFIENVHGNENSWIYFLGVDLENVIFQGNTEALHFSDISYLQIENLTFRGQTANGMNIDDAGTFDTPSHHIRLANCHFSDMGNQGNNDFLKLSGVDFFHVEDCSFTNGAQGGSGIDMVGCHRGKISLCNFKNLGSNSIQAKGGSQHIEIYRNRFQNGGQRTLNLGGSTGLAFFRPQDAPYEAADIQVFSNIIMSSWAPVAFVGCVRVQVFNNTIILPQNWIIRILQETVDPSRFLPCGQNDFVNNIIFYNAGLSRHVNIGPNTAAESFIFSNNLWFNADNPQNSAPDLPVQESGALIGQDPLFNNLASEDFSLTPQSPAINAGIPTSAYADYAGNPMPSGPKFDIGAFEWQETSSNEASKIRSTLIDCFPNPFTSNLNIVNHQPTPVDVCILDEKGNVVFHQKNLAAGLSQINILGELKTGVYFFMTPGQMEMIIKQ